MPQMAPLNWLTLMIYFIFIFLIFNITNFYILKYTPKSLKKSKTSLSYNWKW